MMTDAPIGMKSLATKNVTIIFIKDVGGIKCLRNPVNYIQ